MRTPSTKRKCDALALSGFYGDDNVGDDLLQLALIQGIRENFEHKKIVVFTSNVAKNTRLFEKEGLSADHLDLIYSGRWGLRDRNRRGVRAYYWIVRNLNELKRCDIHLIGPGNLIKDNTNRFLASFWLIRGFLSYVLRKPFAFFAIGVADVKHYHSKLLIEQILNRALFITTRDRTSAKKLRRLNVNTPSIFAFTDLTYAMLNRGRTRYRRKRRKIRKIGINFANFTEKFFERRVIENYKKVILEFMRKILESDTCRLVFFSFAGESHFNDYAMYQLILSEMKDCSNRISCYSYRNISDLREEIATCDAFIGTRFHSVIFAAQGCVPTIALSYDWKVRNFLSEGGLRDYVVDVEGLIIEQLLRSWDLLKLNYTDYTAHLMKLNAKYHTQSLKHFDVLRKHI